MSPSPRLSPHHGGIALGALALVLTFALGWTYAGNAHGEAPANRASKGTQASCYGPGLIGNAMADGTTLHAGTVAVAHRTLPLGTRLYVRTLGVTIITTVRDRGPYATDGAGRYTRTLDLTQGAVGKFGIASCRTWGVRTVRSWRAS